VDDFLGGSSSQWKKGDRVCALMGGGGYAEYALIRAEMAMKIPDSLSFEQAAAIPEAFLTAYQVETSWRDIHIIPFNPTLTLIFKALFWLADIERYEREHTDPKVCTSSQTRHVYQFHSIAYC